MNIFGMNITGKEMFLTAMSGIGVTVLLIIYNKFFKSNDNTGPDVNDVDQSGSTVHGDQVGRDKTTKK